MERKPGSRSDAPDKELRDVYLLLDRKDAADNTWILRPKNEGIGNSAADMQGERGIYAPCSSDRPDNQHALSGADGDASSPEEKGSWETIWDSQFPSPETKADSSKIQQLLQGTAPNDEDIVFIDNFSDSDRNCFGYQSPSPYIYPHSVQGYAPTHARRESGTVNRISLGGTHNGQLFSGNSPSSPSTVSPTDSQSSSELSPTSVSQDPRHITLSSASSSSSSQQSFGGLPSALRSKPIDIRRKKTVLIQLDNATIVAPTSDYESNEDPISCESAILQPRSPPQSLDKMPSQNPFSSIFAHKKASDQKTDKGAKEFKDRPSGVKRFMKLDPRQKASVTATHPSDSDVSSLDLGPALGYDPSNKGTKNQKAKDDDSYSVAVSSSDMSFTNEHPISSRKRRVATFFDSRPTVSRFGSTSALSKADYPAAFYSSNPSTTSLHNTENPFARSHESALAYGTSASTGNTFSMKTETETPEEAEKSKEG